MITDSEASEEASEASSSSLAPLYALTRRNCGEVAESIKDASKDELLLRDVIFL